jgi:hypothetical protein
LRSKAMAKEAGRYCGPSYSGIGPSQAKYARGALRPEYNSSKIN